LIHVSRDTIPLKRFTSGFETRIFVIQKLCSCTSFISYTVYLGCTLGWVDIGTSTGVQSGFVYFHEKTRKTAKKSFLVK
jgi:hypothetical protein